MSRGAEILELLASEDVKSGEVDLGMAVLASLGGGHIDYLARAALDDDEAVLAQSRALHWVSGRGTGIDGLEGVVMLECVSLNSWWEVFFELLLSRGLVQGAMRGGFPLPKA
jgi:hypothetical protein